MDGFIASTPFGARSVTYALLKRQALTRDTDRQARIDKWRLHRLLCEAKTVFGVSDRSLAVLSALLSFYPETELTAESNLIVFPSNRQLSLRAHGMADATLRRHLAALVEANLIARHDSPNGKRYARRAKGGELKVAFGFSLQPLLVRAHEIEKAAEQVKAAKIALTETREQLSLLRRDIAKMLELPVADEYLTRWSQLLAQFRHVVASIPRRAELDELKIFVSQLAEIRAQIDKLLALNEKTSFSSGNESQNERHLNNSESDSHSEQAQGKSEIRTPINQMPSVTLDIVLRSCPEISNYSIQPIRHWSELYATASQIHTFLGIDRRLFLHATQQLGKEMAAIAIACLLQRSDTIRSAGGYLRILIDKSLKGQDPVQALLQSAISIRQKRQSSEQTPSSRKAHPD
ncbi:plasmid replication protein RepC [Daeguia caeni]|uniref:Plasmid replication protein RepC n=1 Tax=Daeguia caeni TaxID=439612 RepID=A0ABV9H0V6_9HYPH